MRVESAGSGELSCGGFRILYDPEPRLRLVPGERRLPAGAAEAVLRGLDEAPHLYAQGLRVRPPQRPWERVEVSLAPGSSEVQGEALEVGLGCIRLSLGEGADPADAAAIARHEALHLLLAAGMPSGEKWEDPELAFADWIVRGLEALRSPPRLTRNAGILEKLPRSRVEVREREPAQFGALAEQLSTSSPQHRLWLAEAALGTHFLEAATMLSADAGSELTAVVLDDWLSDYEQYARGIGGMPSGAGRLWRLSEPGFARDVLVRLSAAAASLACDDNDVFAADRYSRADERMVWKSRGRVRVPILWREAKPRPPPLIALRAVARGAPEALALIEDAARSCENFEARALWPRVLARLSSWAGPEIEPVSLPIVQPLDEAAHREWSAALESLQQMSFAAWLPRIEPVRPIAALLSTRTSMLLVSSAPLGVRELCEARKAAAAQPIRGAVFSDLQQGIARERAPDLPAPLDPRYREEVWVPGSQALSIDDATRAGRCTTAAAHLLSLTVPGIVECPPVSAPSR
jgi:hypothetical protein